MLKLWFVLWGRDNRIKKIKGFGIGQGRLGWYEWPRKGVLEKGHGRGVKNNCNIFIVFLHTWHKFNKTVVPFVPH